MKILLCFGTRPEAIKMASLFHELKSRHLNVKVCVTAQHREMLDQVLNFFNITPDFDLNLMKQNQTLNGLSSNILNEIELLLSNENPDLVLVHGDTTTSSMVSLAAFHKGVKVAHVEAGLRTYNIQSPFPEEFNRQLVSKIANIHFTPTPLSTNNLIKEGIALSDIKQVGNTVIDALLWTLNKVENNNYSNKEIALIKKTITFNKKIILVTGHRRENFGDGFKQLCEALIEISKKRDILIIYPVHLNPNVKTIVYNMLSGYQKIHLIDPVTYPTFVWLMKQSHVIVTDSGGIQEEAPSLGKPVIVTRSVSERPEGVAAGLSVLVGTKKSKIIDATVNAIDKLVDNKAISNPYGDGTASKQIVDYIIDKYKIV